MDELASFESYSSFWDELPAAPAVLEDDVFADILSSVEDAPLELEVDAV